MPSGRGSSSSSYVLAEAIRAGTAPAAIVLREPDGIVALGAIVARELYDVNIPVVVPGADAYDAIVDGVRSWWTLPTTSDGGRGEPPSS